MQLRSLPFPNYFHGSKSNALLRTSETGKRQKQIHKQTKDLHVGGTRGGVK